MFRQYGEPLPGAALAKLGVCRFVPPRGTEARRPPAGRPGSPMMCGGAAENCAHGGVRRSTGNTACATHAAAVNAPRVVLVPGCLARYAWPCSDAQPWRTAMPTRRARARARTQRAHTHTPPPLPPSTTQRPCSCSQGWGHSQCTSGSPLPTTRGSSTSASPPTLAHCRPTTCTRRGGAPRASKPGRGHVLPEPCSFA